MSTAQDCKVKMQAHLKDSGLDRKIGAGLLDSWVRQFEDMQKESLTKAEYEAKINDFVENQIKRIQTKDRIAKIFTMNKSNDAFDAVKANTAQWKEDFANGKRGIFFKANPDKIAVEATRVAIEGGALRAGESTNLSPRVGASTTFDRLTSQFHESIKDIKEEAGSGKVDQGFFQEVSAIDNGTTKGLSKDPVAEKYAKAYVALRDKIFELKQAMNPYLEKAQDYVMRQFHDREKTAAVDKDTWVGKMMERAGEKSFPDQDAAGKRRAFGDTYDHIVDGTYGKSIDEESMDREYSKGRDVFRSQSAGRQILFNDWKAQWDHFNDFGPGTVYQGIDKMIMRASQDIATLDKAGPRPQQWFNRLTNKVLASLEGNEAKVYEDHIPYLQKVFNSALNGAQDAPARGKLAVAVKGDMAVQYLSKVGGIYHALQDPVLAMSLVRDLNGKTLLQNSAGIIKGYIQGMAPVFGPEHVKKVMTDLGLFWHSGHSELMATMGAPGDQPGTMSKVIQTMGSLNLYQRHVDAMRSATATVLSKLLGDHADIAHEQLPDRMQRGLLRYGIGEHEWNIIRQTGGEQLYGHNMLVPENVEHMPDTAAELYLRRSGQYDGEGKPSKQILDRARFDLARKLGMMVNEHADLASATPDLRQRTFLWGDTNINSAEGMLRRVITQFHSAAMVTNDVYRRGYFSGDAPKGDMSGVMQHAVMGMFMAGLTEYAKQFIEEGKTPESPLDPGFVAKMVARSGFGGQFTDGMISAAQRSGSSNIALSLLGNLAGPTFGTVAETAGVGIQALKQSLGAKRDRTLGPTAVSLLQSNIPLQNLWATRAMANYYLWNQLKEFMGHGYLSHLAGRTQQTPGLLDNKQQYLFAKPTSRPLDQPPLGIGR